MPRVLACLLLSSVIAISAAAQNTRNASADQSMILALENSWNQAELHHDAEAADAILADRFVSVDHHGELATRAQYLAGVKDKSFHPEQIVNTDTSVYVYGNTAIVTSAYMTKGASDGKAFVHHGRFTDTWVNLDGKWKCIANQETLISK